MTKKIGIGLVLLVVAILHIDAMRQIHNYLPWGLQWAVAFISAGIITWVFLWEKIFIIVNNEIASKKDGTPLVLCVICSVVDLIAGPIISRTESITHLLASNSDGKFWVIVGSIILTALALGFHIWYMAVDPKKFEERIARRGLVIANDHIDNEVNLLLNNPTFVKETLNQEVVARATAALQANQPQKK